MVYHMRMKPQLYIGNKNYSTWSLRSWLLLREAEIDFDEHRILLDVETTEAEIAAVSPAGMVPVLKLGELTVWDTMAIAETVAERWPEKKLWPEDPDERAFARSICAEMHSGFAELREQMPMMNAATYWHSWTGVRTTIADCRNVEALMDHPWVIDRDELDWREVTPG